MSHDSTADCHGLGITTDLGSGVHAYIQPDGSWWINNAGFIVGGERVTLVDTTSTARRTRQLLAAVAEVSADHSPDVVVNTHHHGDHTFGNCMVSGATIIGHPRARSDMREFGDPPELTSWHQIDWGGLRARVPDVTVSSAVTIWHGETAVEVLAVDGPAHSNGDLITWIPDAGVLFAGDLLFNGGTPFVLGGSVEGLRRTIEEQLRPLAPERIVPGHGPVADQNLFEETIAYLDFLAAVAEEGYARGASPLEVASRLDLGDFADLLDAERIVANLHRAYAEIPGSDFRVDEAAAFADMVALNGGPLATHA